MKVFPPSFLFLNPFFSFPLSSFAFQVFDLMEGGPEPGLTMYRNDPNLRVVVCGGDGSVCWVHGVMDKMGFDPFPSVAVLPLGTGF